MQWFPVKGFEGDYEVSEDGSTVRSLTRQRWFGNARRTVLGRIMRLNCKGKYVLRSLTRGTLCLTPEEIEPVIKPTQSHNNEENDPLSEENSVPGREINGK